MTEQLAHDLRKTDGCKLSVHLLVPGIVFYYFLFLHEVHLLLLFFPYSFFLPVFLLPYLPGYTFTSMTSRGNGEKPAGAWSTDQVAERLVQGLNNGDFCILLCLYYHYSFLLSYICFFLFYVIWFYSFYLCYSFYSFYSILFLSHSQI
jgi:hypothetical protein